MSLLGLPLTLILSIKTSQSHSLELIHRWAATLNEPCVLEWSPTVSPPHNQRFVFLLVQCGAPNGPQDHQDSVQLVCNSKIKKMQFVLLITITKGFFANNQSYLGRPYVVIAVNPGTPERWIKVDIARLRYVMVRHVVGMGSSPYCAMSMWGLRIPLHVRWIQLCERLQVNNIDFQSKWVISS